MQRHDTLETEEDIEWLEQQKQRMAEVGELPCREFVIISVRLREKMVAQLRRLASEDCQNLLEDDEWMSKLLNTSRLELLTADLHNSSHRPDSAIENILDVLEQFRQDR